MFYKKDVLKDFATFTGKRLCKSLFLNKVVISACEFCKFLRTSFLQNTFRSLLLSFSFSRSSNKPFYNLKSIMLPKLVMISFVAICTTFNAATYVMTINCFSPTSKSNGLPLNNVEGSK